MTERTGNVAEGARWGIYYLAWVVLGVVFLVFVPLPELVAGMARGVASGIVNLIVSVYVLGFLAPLAILTSRLVPIGREQLVRAIVAHLFAAAAFTLLHWIAVTWIIDHAFDVRTLGVSGRGPGPRPSPEVHLFYMLVRHIGLSFLGYWLVVGLWHAVDASNKLRQRELQASQLEAQLATAKLQALRDQLHPHFLFNTLNTLSSLIYEDVHAADKVIRDLSTLLRLALDNAGAHTVSLADEMKFVELYLEIMKTRYPERLRVDVRIDPATAALEVPNLLLQPIVENSIKHGLESTGGVGEIHIESGRDDGRLWVDVIDNGPGLTRDPADALAGGVGLRNTRDRLIQLYGDAQRLEIANREGGGVRVRIEIPARAAGTTGAP